MFCGIAGMAALSGCTEIVSDFSEDQVGHTHTIDDEIDMTVDRLEVQEGGSITLDEFTLSGGSDNITFVLPHVVATNLTESTIASPSFDSFRLRSGGVPRDNYRTDYDEEIENFGSSILEPVSGPLFPSVPEIGPEEQVEGWLVFRIPTGEESVGLEAQINDEIYQWSLLI